MALLALAIGGMIPVRADAQVLGTFHWQTQPFCNVITVTVTQQGAEFLLDGTDDQCGAGQKAAVRGLGFFNPDGSVGFGLNIVTAPGGVPVHVDAAIAIPTLSGPWRDSAGRTGQFAFGANATGLSPRPASGLGAASIDTTQMQRRITGTCPAGQVIAAVGQTGSVTCQAVSGTAGGDITSVGAGPGLLGGGTTGDVLLQVLFSGPGNLAEAARSDHRHEVGASSVAIGSGALFNQTTGTDNSAVGQLALLALTSGSRNTGLGSAALRAEATGVANTAIGNAALASHTTGNGNVAVGDSSLTNVTSGNFATAVGYGSLASNTTGAANTALGASALNANTSGADNTAAGYEALLSNTTGGRNTAVGSGTLRAETTGVANTAIGNKALAVHTTGNGNVAVGDSALANMVSGSNEVAVGYGALASTATGDANTAIGASALNAATSLASLNTATGFEALKSIVTGDQNTAVGYHALRSITGGVDNSVFGSQALSDLTNGSGNLAIGAGAGLNLLSGNNNIYLGSDALPVASTAESSTTRIGRVQLRAFIAGIRGRTTGSADAVPVVIDSSGQLGTVSSSRRFKDNVVDLGPVSRRIFDLRPVSFTYKEPFADGSTPVQYGLIAEEVNEVMPELVARNKDGEIETVKYHVLPTLLLAEVQRLERERADQEIRMAAQQRHAEVQRAELAAQRAEIAALRTLLEQLQRQLTVAPR